MLLEGRLQHVERVDVGDPLDVFRRLEVRRGLADCGTQRVAVGPLQLDLEAVHAAQLAERGRRRAEDPGWGLQLPQGCREPQGESDDDLGRPQ